MGKAVVVVFRDILVDQKKKGKSRGIVSHSRRKRFFLSSLNKSNPTAYRMCPFGIE